MLPRPSSDSPPMFENAFVDRFSRTPWLAVPAFHLPVVLWALSEGVRRGGGGLRDATLTFALGALLWTLSEYWLHRTLFHWRPPGRWGARMHFILHGVHHDWPRDRYRLVFPPALSLTLAALFYLTFDALLGARGPYCYAGFATGYVIYDLLHFYLHHARPRWSVLKRLRTHHLLHHSPRKGEDQRFGVTTTLWDHVFGTYRAR